MLFFRRKRTPGGEPAATPAPEAPVQSRVLTGLFASLQRQVEHGGTPRVLLSGPPSGPMIESFTRIGCRVAVEADDAARVPISQPDDTFDLVLGFDALDTLDDEKARALTAEWTRILRPAGRLYLVTRAAHNDVRDALRFEIDSRGSITVHRLRPLAAFLFRRSSRELEQIVAPLAPDENFLRRDGLREFLSRKRAL